MKWLKDRFYYAFQGLFYAFKNDKSIRFQGILGLMAILAGCLFHISKVEWMWVGLCIVLVLFAEFMNSIIERIVDYISLERNEKAKHIKDMAAAATLIICLFALFIALIIFIPKLKEVFYVL
ncbi:MAG: diacylglycerol kinase family protein [Holdemanella sp.]|nr:diacylglycerol kinase family protein [Holdemanella sp.]